MYPLARRRTEAEVEALFGFYRRHRTEYEGSTLNIVRSALDGPCGVCDNPRDREEFFCSEWATAMLIEAGQLPASTNESEVTPQDLFVYAEGMRGARRIRQRGPRVGCCARLAMWCDFSK